MTRIAGHDFTGLADRCSCGKRFADIAGSTADDIGQLFIAHIGTLNAAEATEIRERREREWAATCEVAGG